ncbi:MAG: hypothetical protein HY905_16545 [Deltaproteobacteria bacterium]|nr:hypothetical protein [Deltaproteobacteria bacterium]
MRHWWGMKTTGWGTPRRACGSIGWMFACVVAGPWSGCILDGRPILAGDAPAFDTGADELPDAVADADADADRSGDGDAAVDADAADDADALEADGEIADESTDAVEAADEGGSACRLMPDPPTTLSAAVELDRPQALAFADPTSSTGPFGVLWRAPGPAMFDGLHFQRFDWEGHPERAPTFVLGGVELREVHPILELPDGRLAIALSIPGGAGEGMWIKVAGSSGTGGAAPEQVPGTDAVSSAPSLAFDGSELVLAWLDGSTGRDRIRVQRFGAADGVALGTDEVVASASAVLAGPRLVWSGTGATLVYRDGGDDALHVLALDESLAVAREDVVTAPAGHVMVGSPALAFNGSELGLLWETRDDVAGAIYLATFLPGEAPVLHEPLADLSLSIGETGELDLTAGGVTTWVLAWRHVRVGRAGVSLAFVDASSLSRIGDPVDATPAATDVRNPGIAHSAGSTMVIWAEPNGTAFSIRETVYSCEPAGS